MMVTLIEDSLNPVGNAALFTDGQWLDALLAFEAALAAAQAAHGLIPAQAAEAIAQACGAVVLDRSRFIERARRTGALGIGLVEPLREYLAQHAPDAVRWLHWGSTTQDAVDTAHAMLTRDAVDALLGEVDGLVAALAAMGREHAATPIIGRSLMQPAQITTFGLKCAQSAVALQRSADQLRALAPLALCVQLGGAVGNRAALGSWAGDADASVSACSDAVSDDAASGAWAVAVAVERTLAARLGLNACGHSWHTQRDAWMRLGMEAAVCAGSLAKLARDWALLSQFEVGEVAEASGGSTSSAMPHKRNSVRCMQAIAQAQQVPGLAATLLGTMAQANERALGEWQAELSAWAPLWRHTHGAAAAMRLAAEGLHVDAGRMQANIDALCEVVYSEACAQALTPVVGRDAASKAVERLAAQALASRQPLTLWLRQWVQADRGPEQAAAAGRALAEAANPAPAVQASAAGCLTLLNTLDAQQGNSVESCSDRSANVFKERSNA